MTKITRPHVMFITSVFGDHAIGGAERQVAQIAQGLLDQQYRVSILSLGAQTSRHPSSTLKGWTHQQIALFQCYDPYQLHHQQKIHPHAWQKLLWHMLDVYNPIMARRVDLMLEQLQPDVVITNPLQGFSTAVWSVIKDRRLPLIHVLHDHALLCPNTAMTRGNQVCTRLCQQCAYFSMARRWLSQSSWPDFIVAPSHSVLKRHQQYGWFVHTPSQVIANALPADWPADTAAILHRPPALDQPLTIGFLGRFNVSKGIDVFYEALCLLVQSAHPPTLYLALAGQDEDDWVARFLALGQQHPNLHIRYHGLVYTPHFIQQLDILVVPSKAAETFCNVVMEAASLGVPSIVSQQGALPERVEQGQTGWMFVIDQPQQLAQQLITLAQQPLQVHQMAQKAYAARPSFAFARQLAEYQNVIDQLWNADQ